MARITIQECWWSDLRRSKLGRLLGSEDMADAAALRMWRLAQEFWKHNRGEIPIHIWDHFEHRAQCIEAGLAVVRERSVYVRGSSTYLEPENEQE